MNKFEQLGLNESLLKAILDLGFENPSEVQEKAIPLLLEKDTDMVALAQTGTGKTAAFGFPVTSVSVILYVVKGIFVIVTDSPAFN